MENELNKLFKEIADLVSSHSDWKHIYGLITFEFYPNKMCSFSVYARDNNGDFEKVSLYSAGLTSDLSRIARAIHNIFDSDVNLRKPDQLLFRIDRKVDQAEYHFIYDIADKPNYSSFDEMLYFEYHLMGLIPEDSFNRKLLNNALSYHGENPLD